jgi:TetR/AcrR family transcriptional regulator
MMGSDEDIFVKLRFFVDKYISLILNHPYLPGFIINELNRNPKLLSEIFERNVGFERFNLLDKLDEQIKQEVEAGNMIPIDARSLMVNTLSLCIFPIVAKPIVGTILFNNDQRVYKEFLIRRKTEVADFIINSIKVK